MKKEDKFEPFYDSKLIQSWIDNLKNKNKMALEQISGKVVKFTEIPQELTEEHWLSDHYPDSYVQVHIDEEDAETDEVDKWLKANYPELVDEDYFFIHIDY